MGLEATVICLDNSEWSRNADYSPSRFRAQADAASVVTTAKTQQHNESTVAVMTSAGDSPEVLVTLTNEVGLILTAVSQVKLSKYSANFSSSLEVAAMVLKHRQNKHQRQRVVTFVASPITEEVASLVKLGKKLKKNNVAVDVVAVTDDEQSLEKISKFQEAVNKSDNSNVVFVPPNSGLVSDVILSTPIIQEEGVNTAAVAQAAAGHSAAAANDFTPMELEAFASMGIDPQADPDMALAIRMSLQDQAGAFDAPSETGAVVEGGMEAEDEFDDPELAAALAMSVEEEAPVETKEETPEDKEKAMEKEFIALGLTAEDLEGMTLDEKEELLMAMKMSEDTDMVEEEPAATEEGVVTRSTPLSPPRDTSGVVSNVNVNLPGVDSDDQTLDDVLSHFGAPQNKEEPKKD
eukprot:TRINITY_DN4768_c0_g1_i1.p1 TRINITY_DN4768_c0_g1~~TRINITY_DN4768_c0_g1_i1.p1  ORF type:complete len:407 (-),score=109.27 TRINITY_DN4768_c0_g1_i1:40-1260(-)